MTRVLDSIAGLSKSEIECLIDEWVVGEDAERDRALLRRRMIDGIHFEPLGEEFLLSTQRTKEIVYKRMNSLVKHLKDK
jgi:hypothetical protein